ncbi:MAG: hypothetical protein DNFNHJIP_00677 [Candidatus Argoarchaeum ethanivorans]|uniref:Uncharacterized protein n=1 Tax=Candidatus Argoarchaeum ethanivorans TaxID=2608793 RepID=A0A812A2W9_9EURY|nr:MAG: hypothetical protein DNFNHJIP_00677 [Candidatus Argoarchaeum ethanivorans]
MPITTTSTVGIIFLSKGMSFSFRWLSVSAVVIRFGEKEAIILETDSGAAMCTRSTPHRRAAMAHSAGAPE